MKNIYVKRTGINSLLRRNLLIDVIVFRLNLNDDYYYGYDFFNITEL